MKINKDDSIKTIPVALITGGTRGIGKAIAEQLLRDGFFVIINYPRPSKNVERTKLQFEKISPHSCFLQADICDQKAIKDMFRDIKKKIKAIDVVVSNAGVINNQKKETLENIPLPVLQRLIDVNFLGGINILKKALPLMKKSAHGRVLFINSALSFTGSSRRFGYVTSKTLNVGTVRALALELAPWNICVNAIVPGYINTRMSSFVGNELAAKLEKIPLKRLGDPEDVAQLASFLCSTKSNYITGQHIHVNGGLFFS